MGLDLLHPSYHVVWRYVKGFSKQKTCPAAKARFRIADREKGGDASAGFENGFSKALTSR